MISTGNDIVALKAINVARTQQENFYKKIISGSEKRLYTGQLSEKIPFAIFVWLLWSVKESAFKYMQRITPALVFSPTKIVINRVELPGHDATIKIEGQGFDNVPVYKCVIVSGGDTLYSCSIISPEFIFSVVSQDESFKNVYWSIQKIASSDPESQSGAVRILLMDRLEAVSPESNFQIDKSLHGYPIVLKDGAEISIPVSFAHHEDYIGYSFLVEK